MAYSNAYSYATVSTEHLKGALSLNDGGNSSYFSIPITDRFGERDFPVSLIVPAAGGSASDGCGCLSFLMRIQRPGGPLDKWDLYRPGKAVARFVQGNLGEYFCQETGETLVLTPSLGDPYYVLRCGGVEKAKFPGDGGYLFQYCLPDGMCFSFSASGSQFVLSTQDCGDWTKYRLTAQFGTGGDRSVANLSWLAIQRVYGSSQSTETILTIQKQNGLLNLIRHRSSSEQDETESYGLGTPSSGAYPWVSFAANPAFFEEKIQFAVLSGTESQISATVNGQTVQRRTLSRLSELLWKVTDERGRANHVFLKPISNGLRVQDAYMGHEGLCRRRYHDQNGRVEALSDAVYMDVKSAQSLSLIPNGVFDSAGVPQGWTVASPASIASRTDLQLPSAFGSYWLLLQHYGGYAQCQFSTLPQAGEPVLVMALFSPTGGTSALEIRIDVSYEDGTSEFFTANEALTSVYTPSLIPVAAEIVPQKPVSAMAAKLTVSNGPAYVKSVVAIRGAGIARYEYVSATTDTVAKVSKGGSVGKYYYPTAGDDYASYSYGSGSSPFVTYESGTGLVKTETDDLGNKTTQTYQMIPPTSLTESKNYRLSEVRTETQNDGTAVTIYGHDVDTWRQSSQQKDGVLQMVYSDRQGRVYETEAGDREDRLSFDGYRRLVGVSRQILASYASTAITYGADRASWTATEGIFSTSFAQDSYGRLAAVGQNSNTTVDEAYAYASTDPWSLLASRSVFGKPYSFSWNADETLEKQILTYAAGSTIEWDFAYPCGAQAYPDETLANNQYGLSRAVSCAGSVSDAAWSASSANYLLRHSGFGGDEWAIKPGEGGKVGIVGSSYRCYAGDLKTWYWAMLEEGFFASRMWQTGDAAVLYNSSGSQVSSSSTSVAYRLASDRHLAIELGSADFLLPSSGLPKGVVSFRDGPYPLYIACGSSAISFSVSGGSLSYSAPSTSGTLAKTSDGWNVLAFGFASASSLLVCLNGVAFSIYLPVPFPDSSAATVTLGHSASATYGQIALSVGTAGQDELVAYSLLTLDCVSPDKGPSRLGGHQAASLEAESVVSGAPASYGGMAVIPLSSDFASSNGAEPSYTLPEGVGLGGAIGGVQSYRCLVYPSCFGWSSQHNRPMWRAFGQKLSYPLASCADFAIKMRIDPVVGNISGTRTVLCATDGVGSVTVKMNGSYLKLNLYGTNVSGSVAYSASTPIVLSISTSGSPGSYSVAYGLSCGNASLSGAKAVGHRMGSGRIHLGTSDSGANPFKGLIGGLTVVPRPLAHAAAASMEDNGASVDLESGVDSLGRVSYFGAFLPGQSERGTSFDYGTYSSSDYQSSRIATTKIYFHGSLQKTISCVYDSLGQLSSYDGQTVQRDVRGYITKGFGQQAYYNAAGGNITKLKGSPNLGDVSFGYDTSGRLVSAYTGSWTRTYSYSASMPGFPSSIQNSIGTGPTGNIGLTYRGDLLYSAQVGLTTVDYLYDSNGKVVSRTVGTDVRKYAYDGDRLILDSRSDGTVLFYVYDAVGNPALLIERVSSTLTRRYTIHCDAIGRILFIVPTDGSTGKAEYSYGLYGEIRSVTDTTGTGIGSTNMLRYKGYLYDPLLQMYCLGRRHLDPIVGRFLEPDSTEWLEPRHFGGINPYSYCLNDPIAFSDNSGRFGIPAIIGLLAFAYVAGGTSQLAVNACQGKVGDELWRGVAGSAFGSLVNMAALIAAPFSAGTTLVFAAGLGAAATSGVNLIETSMRGEAINWKQESLAFLSNFGSNLIGNYIGAKLVPTNSGWFQTKHFISVFTKPYGQRLLAQIAIGALLSFCGGTVMGYLERQKSNPDYEWYWRWIYG